MRLDVSSSRSAPPGFGPFGVGSVQHDHLEQPCHGYTALDSTTSKHPVQLCGACRLADNRLMASRYSSGPTKQATLELWRGCERSGWSLLSQRHACFPRAARTPKRNRGSSDNKASQSPTVEQTALPAPTNPKLPVAAEAEWTTAEGLNISTRFAIHAVRRLQDATVVDWSVTPLSAPGYGLGDRLPSWVDLGLSRTSGGRHQHVPARPSRRERSIER